MILQMKNISFSYPGGKSVLEDITLEIMEKQLTIVRGESGAGKSTLLKLFNRFIDYTKGNIHFHGKELTDYGIEEIRRSIIYLPQLPHMIDGTIEENLTFPFSFHVHKDKQYLAREAQEWLEHFQLKVPRSHDALKLSIGQKQRIALIRAMLLKPEVLLLDEPGSALDSVNKKLIEQKIESLIETSDITVIMATHSNVSFAHAGYREIVLENMRLKVMR
jgi:putative ABC transport system ATP-binding protein